jgi:ABC-type Fe3+ transport system permease subunit
MEGADMEIMGFVVLAILVIGVVSLVLSTTVLFHRVPKTVRSKEWFQKEPERWDSSVRLWIFIFWILVLPVYSLAQWYIHRPSPAEFAVFAYEHKVLSDFWTAVTVALGLLWGIKR